MRRRLTTGRPCELPRQVLTEGHGHPGRRRFLFGIGNVALLSLVARVGTGVGFTIAQLSLLVNSSIGIWVFKVPPPGGRPDWMAIAGIVMAGVGSAAIGAAQIALTLQALGRAAQRRISTLSLLLGRSPQAIT